MLKFQNQNVIVTGGTRGIGRAITEAFLKEGAKVVATYFSQDEAAMKFKESMGSYGEQLILKKFDIASFEQCQKFFHEVEAELNNVHVLINNSGIRKDNLAAVMSPDDWDKVLNTNLKGSFYMSQLAVLNFLKNRYGRIVNISSIGGMLCLPGQANYAASKAGQMAMAKSLSKEVAKKNITVNNVCPGFIDTELLADLPEEQKAEYKKQIPMKRFGKAEEVAHAVLFLASAEAAYITGTNLEISGGLG
ncbi:MAG: 3-oxoacyl-ACP reductase FabG [Bacteriovoracaceae bacterium]|nr:3-oxoacyl-ACP reductase FabG [Bacteriovoracaceae bacterium]